MLIKEAFTRLTDLFYFWEWHLLESDIEDMRHLSVSGHLLVHIQ